LIKPQHPWNSGIVRFLIEAFSGLKVQEGSHVNKDSSPIKVIFLFIIDVIQLLVAETDKYYN
jgi:hypothetical protein